MSSFAIVTDSTANLPKAFIEKQRDLCTASYVDLRRERI